MAPQGYYPQQPYYAEGWRAPVPTEQSGSVTRPRRSRKAIVIPIVAVVGIAVVIGTAVSVRFLLDRRPLGEVTSPTTVAVGRVDVGHCIEDLPVDGEVTRVRLVPCDDPHEATVVGARDLGAGDWPGEDVISSELADWCEMDNGQAAQGLRAVVWAPSERSWAQGDHQGLCLAWADSGTVSTAPGT